MSKIIPNLSDDEEYYDEEESSLDRNEDAYSNPEVPVA
jgi:hypothetical protein